MRDRQVILDELLTTIREWRIELKYNPNHVQSGPNGGQFTSGAGGESLSDTENKIRNQKFESAGLFKDGKQIFFKDGKSVEVEFTDDELKKMEGALLTHNHPMDRSFSEEDVGFFKDYSLSEMRAVSKNHTYILKNPNNIKLTENVVKDYRSLLTLQARKLQEDIDKKLISESFANENIHHQVMKKLATGYNLTYVKINL